MFRSPFFQHYNNVEEERTQQRHVPHFFQVIKECWIYALTVFVTFTVTLCIFPSVAVLVESEGSKNSSWSEKYFTPVTVFLLFNVGDFVGRYLATWLKIPGRTILGKIIVLTVAIMRSAFIPLFIYCNIPPENLTKGTDNVLFKSDADFILFMALFSLSNGKN